MNKCYSKKRVYRQVAMTLNIAFVSSIRFDFLNIVIAEVRDGSVVRTSPLFR